MMQNANAIIPSPVTPGMMVEFVPLSDGTLEPMEFDPRHQTHVHRATWPDLNCKICGIPL